MSPLPFDPDYVVAPGDTLAHWFAEKGLVTDGGRASCADRFGIRGTRLFAFLNGGPLDEDLAIRLALMTGISKVFWIALEQNFRVGLAAGKTWSRS